MDSPSSNFPVDANTLKVIGLKLSAVDPNSTPDYWRTAFKFIGYASAQLNVNVPTPGKATLSFRENSGFGGIRINFPISHQVVLLDGGDLGPLSFENCRIIFTKNPVRMLNVNFVNCVFEMPVTQQPSEFLRKSARQLLSSNLTTISSVS